MLAVIRTAAYYNLDKMLDVLKSRLMNHVVEDPVPVYFIASELGWTAEAQQAATAALDIEMDGVFFPILEHVHVPAYHRLLSIILNAAPPPLSSSRRAVLTCGARASWIEIRQRWQ